MWSASRLLLLLLLGALPVAAQFTPGGTLGGKRIQGQVRLGGEPAPQGVLVLLDRARGHDSSFNSGSGELGNTMTDSRGKFLFDHIDQGQELPEGARYVITVRFPGYVGESQIVDVSGSPAGFAHFDLRREKSESPNVPPAGPSEMISAHQPTTSEGREALANGQSLLLEKHDPKGSIAEFKKLTRAEPQYGPGYLLLGTACMQMQDWSAAKSAFEKAVKLEPQNASAHIGLGAALNAEQNYSAALAALERALVLNPQSSEGQYEMGRSLWAMGKWQQAEPHVLKAIEVNKTFPPPHVLMGNIYLRHRDARSALSEFQRYLDLDPQGPQAPAVQEIIARIHKALEAQKK